MKRRHLPAMFAGALLCGFSGMANAQQSGQAAARAESEDQAKFFVFHAQGVSFEQARADYYYCIAQARPILTLRDKMGGGGGGLLGALINGRMAEIDRLRMRNAAMRQCMHFMGYERYRMPQAEWNVMVADGDIVLNNAHQVDPTVVDRLAHYASGPMPATERLDP